MDYPLVTLSNHIDIYHSINENRMLVKIQRLNDKYNAMDTMEFEYPNGEITNIIGFSEEEAKYYHNEYITRIAAGGNLSLESEEDAIEEIMKFWLENASEQDAATTAQAEKIMMKIDFSHMLMSLEYEEAVTYIKKNGMKLEGYTPDEINKIMIIANFWLRNAIEPDKETKALVDKILMKIDHWYIQALCKSFRGLRRSTT